ncbi:ABC transporter ATP-binding protein [Cytophagaceae bacterium ABcell3]|nr:ABC transporter ATP-binding protein [Cytophagaceae bacterium ABcell3]
MASLTYLNKYLYKYKKRLLLGVVFVILANIFATVQGPVIREVIDFLSVAFQEYQQVEQEDAKAALKSDIYASITNYSLLIIGLALVSGIFLYFQRQLIIGVSRYIEYDLKNEIYAHYQTLPLTFYRKHSTGDLMARISEDVNHVRMYLGPALMYGINLTILFFIILSYMLSVNVSLTLYALLPLPLLSLSIWYVSTIINKKSTQIQQSLSTLSNYVQEAFSGIRVIKAFVREKNSTERFIDISNDYRKRSLELARVHAFFHPLVLMLTGISTIIIIYVGGRKVIGEEISFGNIVEFIFYLNKLTWPFASLGWTTSLIQRAAASQTRINEFLNTKTDIVSKKNIRKEIEGGIEFKNVSFVYPDSGIKALTDISFKTPPGASIGIIGATGSGKTTLANLICRMYDPTKGSIEIDGVNSKDYDPSHLRSHIGYVPQDVFLFSDSIRNNLTFGAGQLPENKVVRYAEQADLLANIEAFPKKFETVLGERGITLSGGQKQRLSIARAIAREPKILILDDCLSAVDTKTENTILNSIKQVMKNRTTIIIAHRISSVKLAENIIVLSEGKIVEQGKHKELLQKKGLYRDMYQKQLHGFEEHKDQ